MRAVVTALVLSTLLSGHAPPPRAYYAHVTVTAPSPIAVRAIWRPYAVSLGPYDGAAWDKLGARVRRMSPDSVRRMRDTTARDTVQLVTPAEFTADFSKGSVLLEVTGPDSVQVATQLVPMGGHVAVERGRTFRLPRPGYLPPFGRNQ